MVRILLRWSVTLSLRMANVDCLGHMKLKNLWSLQGLRLPCVDHSFRTHFLPPVPDFLAPVSLTRLNFLTILSVPPQKFILRLHLLAHGPKERGSLGITGAQEGIRGINSSIYALLVQWCYSWGYAGLLIPASRDKWWTIKSEQCLTVFAFCWAFGFSTVAVSIRNGTHKRIFLSDWFYCSTSSIQWGWGSTEDTDTETLEKKISEALQRSLDSHRDKHCEQAPHIHSRST